jgi:hypothetical protein
MDKIGTGEGAQAYGHGLYFAESPDVAKSYRDMLASRKFQVGDRELIPTAARTTKALDGQSMAEKIAADSLDDAFNAQSSSPAQFAANRLRQQRSLYPEQAADIDAALSLIGDWQAAGNATKPVGKMYEVNIHADPDDLLDWDKPLSQQPAAVQDLGRKVLSGEIHPDRWDNTPGRVIYEKLNGRPERFLPKQQIIDTPRGPRNDPPMTAEEVLRRRGVPGLKYLDGGSRAAGEGSRNYVIWDDSMIEVLKKYGIALPVIEGLRREAMANGGRVELQ